MTPERHDSVREVRGNALTLGFFSIGAQTLLLKAITSTFGGDEILIGTALFGWLTVVALGAWWGGRWRRVSVTVWFVAGFVLLPIMAAAARLSPLIVADSALETVRLGVTIAVSIAAVAPVAFVSGWLFAAISRGGWKPGEATAETYLWEGLGAFAGGGLVTLVTGPILSTSGSVLLLDLIGVASLLARRLPQRLVVRLVLLLSSVLVAVLLPSLSRRIDVALDSRRFPGYEVLASFDTPYSHQSLLRREGALILVTDDRVEVHNADQAAAEQALLPPLLYCPSAGSILYFGRAELGLAQAATQCSSAELMAVDARRQLSFVLDQYLPQRVPLVRLDNEPLAFCVGQGRAVEADVVVVPLGASSSYLATRLVSVEALARIKRVLSPGGVLMITTVFDTDRFVSEQAAAALGCIVQALRIQFRAVWLWPGEATLIFASDDSTRIAPPDTLLGRLDALRCQPLYMRSEVVAECLDQFRVDRLNDALKGASLPHSVNRPLLMHRQLVFQSRTYFEGRLAAALLERSWWLVGLAGILLLHLLRPLAIASGQKRQRSLGTGLFFIAGSTSIVLELVALYIYQSLAGSLYSHLGLLIGCFMLGLAVGTYSATQLAPRGCDLSALVLMLAATAVLALTWSLIPAEVALGYYACFLIAAATATGALYVAATRHYYGDSFQGNYGAGYALELIGSGLGSLLTLTFLLPMIGVNGVLIAVMVVILVGLGVTWHSHRRRS